MMRQTLANVVEVDGVALHAGSRVRMTLGPAEPNSGIVFRRSDLGGSVVQAQYDRVSQTTLGTVIDNGSGVSVGVIEHLMAALAGAEIDDAVVTIDGPEAPILDGSAIEYLRLIERAGTALSNVPRNVIEVRRSIEVEQGDACASLHRGDSRSFDFEIAFPSRAIGRQNYSWTFSTESFEQEIAPARTFGFTNEMEALNKQGLARGASLQNTLAIDGDTVLNAELMRFPDEFVRHKILDAFGDLALAGAPIVGRFVGRRSGHPLNNKLLRALFSEPANYRRVTLS